MNKKIRTPLAAFLLAIASVLIIFKTIQDHMQGFYFDDIFDYIHYCVFRVLALALCVILFAKKRNILLIITLGCETLFLIYYVVRYFSLYNVIDFIVYALLTVFAVSVCEQTLIKADLSKLKAFTNKFFYLPAILSLANNVIDAIDYFNFLDSRVDFEGFYEIIDFIINNNRDFIYTIIIDILYVFVIFSLGKWLKDPYVKAPPQCATGSSNDEFEQ